MGLRVSLKRQTSGQVPSVSNGEINDLLVLMRLLFISVMPACIKSTYLSDRRETYTKCLKIYIHVQTINFAISIRIT